MSEPRAGTGVPALDETALARMREERIRFLEMVAGVRAELHRYCARMVGSVADGEDVVQDALARAYYELAGLREAPAMRAWLFRIAHNRALDWLRRYDVRMGEALAEDDVYESSTGDPEDALARKQAVGAALSRFMDLAPAQRSCVILADVLEHTAEEIAALLELSVPAVKAALVRGRARLRELHAEVVAPREVVQFSSELLRYIELFNARDWDGVRAMLAEDVKLDLVARAKAAGKRQVAVYYSNYEQKPGWRMAPATLDGREVIAGYRGDAAVPAYYIELRWKEGKLAAIRDYFFVPYILRDAALVLR
jgi:RNA polymerase sigma-70 factor (ECF subfamily)